MDESIPPTLDESILPWRQIQIQTVRISELHVVSDFNSDDSEQPRPIVQQQQQVSQHTIPVISRKMIIISRKKRRIALNINVISRNQSKSHFDSSSNSSSKRAATRRSTACSRATWSRSTRAQTGQSATLPDFQFALTFWRQIQNRSREDSQNSSDGEFDDGSRPSASRSAILQNCAFRQTD